MNGSLKHYSKVKKPDTKCHMVCNCATGEFREEVMSGFQGLHSDCFMGAGIFFWSDEMLGTYIESMVTSTCYYPKYTNELLYCTH